MKLQHELGIFSIIVFFSIVSLALAGSLTGLSVYDPEEEQHEKTFGDYVYEFFSVENIFFSQNLDNDCSAVAEEFLSDFLRESPTKLRGFRSTGSNRILNQAFEGSMGKEFYGNIVLVKGGQFFQSDDSNFVLLKLDLNRLVHTIKDEYVVGLNLTFNGVLEDDKIMITRGNLDTDVIHCEF